ncbi:MAG TPA: metalloregulator ArsR/SmtB family transcription factor [Povalibacter sp.]|nr:metalloregulator ArsR/SmtB family transcription factor [Povalibacter sp.]
MSTSKADLSSLAANAGQAAAMLRALANERRLMILCLLIQASEMSAGELAEEVGISQSALSQHLSKMRDEGLVDFRREAQSSYYRIADPSVKRVIAVLKNIYCDT